MTKEKEDSDLRIKKKNMAYIIRENRFREITQGFLISHKLIKNLQVIYVGKKVSERKSDYQKVFCPTKYLLSHRIK